MRCRNGAAVTLFEKESSCGGHTLTDTSSGYPVDLGFQVRPALVQLGANAHNFSLLSLYRAHFAAPATRSGATPTTPRPCPCNTSPPPQVYNLTTYPHLVSFLEALGVDTQPSDMSFSLSMDGGRLEWASHDLDSVFAQRKNMASPSFLMMLRDVVRFGKEAPKVRGIKTTG